MKALSVRQPWAWLIVNGYKPYENRTWNTRVRGAILIHASLTFDHVGYAWVRETFPEIPLPQPSEFDQGGIVGSANLWEVATASSLPWFTGPFGFCLAEAKTLPFVSLTGRLGFFEADLSPREDA